MDFLNGPLLDKEEEIDPPDINCVNLGPSSTSTLVMLLQLCALVLIIQFDFFAYKRQEINYQDQFTTTQQFVHNYILVVVTHQNEGKQLLLLPFRCRLKVQILNWPIPHDLCKVHIF